MSKYAEYQKTWREKNYDRNRELVKRWQQAHPEKVRFYRAQRRAKMKGTIVVAEIHNWESKVCGICNLPIDGDYHFDHIIPLSKGGEHTSANLQLAHPYCNQSKFNHIISV